MHINVHIEFAPEQWPEVLAIIAWLESRGATKSPPPLQIARRSGSRAGKSKSVNGSDGGQRSTVPRPAR